MFYFGATASLFILLGMGSGVFTSEIPESEWKPGNYSIHGFNPEIFTEILSFRLENETLYDIKKILGETPILEKGEAGNYEAKIVYLLKNGSEKIGFYTDEVHGHWKVFSSFTVTEADENDRRQLKKIALDIKNINIHGIHLGMKKSDVEKVIDTKNILGGFTCQVIKKSNNEKDYEFLKIYQETKKDAEVRTLSEGIGIEVVYHDGILKSFTIGKTTAT